MKPLLSAIVENKVFANLMLVLTILAGGLAAFFIIREEMPNVTFDFVEISVVYPGASPEEVEEGISRKIEEAIEGLEGVKSYSTIAKEGLGMAMVEIKDGYDGMMMLDRVRTKINEISTFPVDSERPLITLPLHREPVMALYLNGTMSEMALQELAYHLKDLLVDLEDVSQVSLAGIRDYEINAEVSEQKLREFGLTFSQVAESIRRGNFAQSGGVIKSDNEEIRIRTLGKKYTASEMADIVVISDPDGAVVTLDSLASIKDGFSDETVKTTVNGHPAILITLYKTNQEDAIRISDAVHGLVDEQKNSLPPGIEIGVLFDNTDSIRHQVNVLLKNGVIGLVTVFLILTLFLKTRLSFWTTMGIVFSVFGGLLVVWLSGGTINMISIFGFIMILGIVTDDSIVVGEAIDWHRSAPSAVKSPALAGLLEVVMPVMAGVLTTVLAFVPLLFIGGLMGKFIRALPIVVIACLLISLFECFFLLPAHLNQPPRQNGTTSTFLGFRLLRSIQETIAGGLDTFSTKIYAPLVIKTIRWRYAFLAGVISLLLVTLGLIAGGLVKFDMLPQRDGFYLSANIRFPEGTSLAQTEKAVQTLESAFYRLAARIKTESGRPLIKNSLTLSGQLPGVEPGNLDETGSHLGGVQFILTDDPKRGISTQELAKAWLAETGPISGAQAVSFTGTIMGDPGKPIEIGIDGNDPLLLSQAEQDLKSKLGRIGGVFDVQSDLIPGKNELRFRLKPDAISLGITVQEIASQLYSGYYGDEVLRLQRGRNSVKIKVRYSEAERTRISSLENVRIRTDQGEEIPLLQVVEVDAGPGFSTITRTDGHRRVTVSADVDTAIIHANEVIAELQQGFFHELESRYPGIHLVLKGDAGESEESFDSMLIGFVLVMFAMYLLVATLFHSYLQPLLILLTIPFGIIGAIWGHYLLGHDLTMISMFGMIGLTGVVLNDAIVLIEKINQNRLSGMPLLEAIREGGIRRFRAIFLTSITTIGGLFSLMVEADPYAFTLQPMAITIVAGITVTTVLTLFLIPVLLVMVNDLNVGLRKLLGMFRY